MTGEINMPSVVTVRASDIKAKSSDLTSGVWPGYIPWGLTILEGGWNTGKAVLACTFAAILSRGQQPPHVAPPFRWVEKPMTGKVLIYSFKKELVTPRLVAAGADTNNIISLTAGGLDAKQFLIMIDEVVECNPDIKLIIIDPLCDAMRDQYDQAALVDVQAQARTISEWAKSAKVSVLGINHRGLDAPGAFQVADSVLMTAKLGYGEFILWRKGDKGVIEYKIKPHAYWSKRPGSRENYANCEDSEHNSIEEGLGKTLLLDVESCYVDWWSYWGHRTGEGLIGLCQRGHWGERGEFRSLDNFRGRLFNDSRATILKQPKSKQSKSEQVKSKQVKLSQRGTLPKQRRAHLGWAACTDVRLRSRCRKYGISEDEYWDMHRAQDGKCAICQEPVEEVLAIDHCHVSKVVRGLLCRRHNTALGKFRDNPEHLRNAAAYLERSMSPECGL